MKYTYYYDLSKRRMPKRATDLLAAYIIKLVGGEVKDNMVLHNKRISKVNQQRILAYIEALEDANVD